MKILFIGDIEVISTACSELFIKKGFDLFLLNRNLSVRKSHDNAKDFTKGLIELLGNPHTFGQAYHITSDEVMS
jgi:hypothetical protein